MKCEAWIFSQSVIGLNTKQLRGEKFPSKTEELLASISLATNDYSFGDDLSLQIRSIERVSTQHGQNKKYT